VACDPYTGTAEAVLECARNLACVGAEPLGLTNCLNFGNPEKPHVAWQLTRAVEGMRDACLALGVPVVGGNVSLYNEGAEGPIYPTPVVGMVGKLPDPERAVGIAFAQEKHEVALVGPFAPVIWGSELDKLLGHLSEGLSPIDLGEQARALEVVRELARSGLLTSAHDVSEGGLACALAECCIQAGVGARADVPDAAFMFGEGPGGVVVSAAPDAMEEIAARCGEIGFRRLGEVGGDALVLTAGVGSLEVSVERAREAYERAIPDRFR
jgi:phosphoribosylformylglycinamidine synthase